jgi:D-xylose transport system permease protein
VDPGAGGGQILLYSIAAAVIGGDQPVRWSRQHQERRARRARDRVHRQRPRLLGLSSGTKFVVTGLVLLAAVTVDSISRKGRAQSGRA